jgi:hypothetical protein
MVIREFVDEHNRRALDWTTRTSASSSGGAAWT